MSATIELTEQPAAVTSLDAAAAKKRVLFVDDEPNVLRGLRRMLRPMRKEWEMSFAESGEEALGVLDQQPVDVVISDMRMPKMDGAQLLTAVADRAPEAVRIILSGHSDEEMIRRSVGAAHQFLSKPCESETLRAAVSRALALREILSDQVLMSLVSSTESLPSMPTMYRDVMRELEGDEPDIRRIADIIAGDLGMTTKMLQLVNSAFFGLRRRVTKPQEAVTLVGLETIKALVLSIGVFTSSGSPRLKGYSIEALYQRSVRVGDIARRIGQHEGYDLMVRNDLFLAGMLHDVGELLLVQGCPGRWAEVRELIASGGRPAWQTELDRLGCTHAEVGAYLLGLWGLPDPVVATVACHPWPSRYTGNALLESVLSESVSRATLAAILHVAAVLAHEGERQDQLDLDLEFLAFAGVGDRVSTWRDVADGQAAAS